MTYPLHPRNSSWPGRLTAVLFVRPTTAGSSLVALTKSNGTIRGIGRATKLSSRNLLAAPRLVRCDVLDIGGGQHALLVKKLWNDHTTVADVTEDHLNYVREQGVETMRWDLSREDPRFSEPFDAIIFSEVIEHLPCAGYVALERLRRCLRREGS